MSATPSPPQRENPYLTVPDAAAFLGLSPHTLNNMRCRGAGPAYRKHANLVYYHIDDLKDYSRRRRFNSTGGSDG